MQVILREDVPHLGHSGEMVTVKEGYGRNYLIPRGMAVIANPKNVARLEHDKRVITQRESKLLQSATSLKDKIEGLSLNVAKQVGEEDKLFGSVTAKEIADALAEQGVTIDRKKIALAEPIKTLGVHTVKVSLGRQIDAELKVWVVAK